jgi:hypothetical protein
MDGLRLKKIKKFNEILQYCYLVYIKCTYSRCGVGVQSGGVKLGCECVNFGGVEVGVAQIWTCLLEGHDIAHIYDNHAYVAITWCMCGDYVTMTSEIGSAETTICIQLLCNYLLGITTTI